MSEVVDTLEFDGSKQTRWRKLTFLVALGGGEVPSVRLNDEEHVDAVWASEVDVMAGQCEGREIEFAYHAQRQTVLDVLRRA